MIDLKKTQQHSIEQIFVLILLTLFAAVAFILVAMGARQYHSIANLMTNNYEKRTISSYLEEKMNQNDGSGTIQMTNVGDSPAIALEEEVNGAVFITYIYCYDGFLYEITVSQDTPVSQGDGQQIIEMEQMSVRFLRANLLEFSITDQKKDTFPVYVSLQSDQ